jgi:hypothetical protein
MCVPPETESISSVGFPTFQTKLAPQFEIASRCRMSGSSSADIGTPSWRYFKFVIGVRETRY